MIKDIRRLLSLSVNAPPEMAQMEELFERSSISAGLRARYLINHPEFLQEKERIFLYEREGYSIIEYLYNRVRPISFLLLVRKSDGAVLNLTQVLSDRSYFLPQEVYKKEGFSALNSGDTGIVVYGDMTQEGSMLSFLHEIVHVWQFGVRDDFVHTIARIKTLLQEFDLREEKKEENINFFNENMKKFGSSIELLLYCPESSFEGVVNFSKEHSVLFLRGNIFLLCVENYSMSKLLRGHLGEERHAWNMATYLLGWISKNFVNLEPDLDERAIEDYMQSRFETHKEAMNKMLRHDWRSA
ncbi:MAG: hypothetical protein ABFQ53_01180 [Patescibacteria group bacterium]